MGLFHRKPKAERKNAAAPNAQDSLISYSGMRVEVLTEKNEPLFMAKLAFSPDGLAELQLLPDNTGPDGDEILHVQLRGYDDVKRKAVHMEGDMSPLSASIWRVEALRVKGSENDRAFYRQDVGTAGDVMLFGQIGMPQVKGCMVLNISAGGACIQADTAYEIGDRLLLRSRLLPNSEMALLCTVCRIVQRRPGTYEYGCKFENLDASAEDQISKAIMQLQMQRRKR